MSYQSRIREIQSAFMLGFQDRLTCIQMFEGLLHEYGMLPVEEHLDRTITNENFLGLLKAAREHRGIHDPIHDAPAPTYSVGSDGQVMATPPSDNQKLEDLKRAEENLRKLTRWMEQMAQRDDRRFRIADSVNRHCPVCHQPTNSLFNRVQSLDHQTIQVEPPRCQPCMMKWVEERFGTPANAVSTPAPLVTTVDGSPTSPLSTSEADFFAEYEKQMQEPQS